MMGGMAGMGLTVLLLFGRIVAAVAVIARQAFDPAQAEIVDSGSRNRLWVEGSRGCLGTARSACAWP